MSGERKQGLAAAIAAVMADGQERPPSAVEADQLSFLPLDLGRGETAEDAQRRGRGRPPGARNKSTEEWRDFILSRFRSPLEALAQTYSMSVWQLAALLGRKEPSFEDLVELLKVQKAAAEAAARYLHSPQPVAVQIDSKGIVHLVVEGLDGPSRAAGGDDVVTIEGVFEHTESEKENADKSDT